MIKIATSCLLLIVMMLNISCITSYKKTSYQKVQSEYKVFSNIIEFETGKYDIKPEYANNLIMFVEILKRFPDMKLQIVGYSVGHDIEHENLSILRAKVVKNFLVSLGADPVRLELTAKNDKTDNASLNNQPDWAPRVEIQKL